MFPASIVCQGSNRHSCNGIEEREHTVKPAYLSVTHAEIFFHGVDNNCDDLTIDKGDQGGDDQDKDNEPGVATVGVGDAFFDGTVSFLVQSDSVQGFLRICYACGSIFGLEISNGWKAGR